MDGLLEGNKIEGNIENKGRRTINTKKEEKRIAGLFALS